MIYNNNILHTGAYNPSSKRATLHGCMGNSRGGAARARNILQHDLRWMRDKEFQESFKDSSVEGEGGEKERLTRMWKLLLEMEKASGGAEKVGYSQHR